jgi:dTDP-4-dehydrorhamnose reductase
MKILITGANGMLARATISHCSEQGDEVIALTRQQLDISDRTQVISTFESYKPEAVINCAAYTDVDGSETNIERCFAANALGVENLAFAARQFDALLVTVSTDYVFDGTKTGFYTQRDTPNPQSVYGKAKLEGEIRARNTYARSIIVRSGWIYGEGGNNFLSKAYDLLKTGNPISAIADSFGTPTFAEDLATRLRQLLDLDLPLIFHVTNSGDGASYADFCRKICQINQWDLNLVKEISSTSLNRPAPRPKNSKLACLFTEKLGLEPLQNWEIALQKFIQRKKQQKITS